MKRIIILYVSGLLLLGFTLTGYHFITRDKIGYVKTGMILQKYQGMLDANKKFDGEVAVVRGNVDTLRMRYERLKLQENSISASKRGEWGYALGLAEKEYLQYNEAAQQQLQQRQQDLTMEVLNKVNTFIQEYGKEKSYKMILGTTNDGSILYGLQEDDLTETILEKLNVKYKDNSKK